MIEINSHLIRSILHALRKSRFKYTNSGAMVHPWPVYIYLLNVPSFSSRYFNKIKRTSRLGRLLALSLEILSCSVESSSKKFITSGSDQRRFVGLYCHFVFMLKGPIKRGPVCHAMAHTTRFPTCLKLK